MIIREYKESDLPAIQISIANREFAFPFPNPSEQGVVIRQVIEDEGLPVGLGLVQMTHQAWMVIDPNWRTPKWRWEALQSLHVNLSAVCDEKRIAEVNAWTPSRAFGRRLVSLGWMQSEYPSYFIRHHGKTS